MRSLAEAESQDWSLANWWDEKQWINPTDPELNLVLILTPTVSSVFSSSTSYPVTVSTERRYIDIMVQV